MKWTEVKIIAPDSIDTLCAELAQLGVAGFHINDPKDLEDFISNKTGNWDYIDDDLLNLKNSRPSVTFYLPDNQQGRETLSLVRCEVRCATDRELIISSVNDEDWADNWKQYFQPFDIGERLTVKPSWEEYTEKNNRVILEIDPASAFGTGQHETTKLCLELLEKHIKGGEKILDIGCGSGILSIAAILLGAEKAAAADTDRHAADTASQNALLNNIPRGKYKTYCGNIISDETLRQKIGGDFDITGTCKKISGNFDIITANIVADVIIAMLPIFAGLIKPSGVIILSGIIEERHGEVLDAMEKQGFKPVEKREDNGWVAIAIRLRSDT